MGYLDKKNSRSKGKNAEKSIASLSQITANQRRENGDWKTRPSELDGKIIDLGKNGLIKVESRKIHNTLCKSVGCIFLNGFAID